MGEKKCDERSVQGEEGGWWVYLRQSWSQWSQRWGRLEQETLLLPLTAPAWASCPLRHRVGTNYACLNVCHTHTRARTHRVKCNLCYTLITCHLMTFKLAPADVYFIPFKVKPQSEILLISVKKTTVLKMEEKEDLYVFLYYSLHLI